MRAGMVEDLRKEIEDGRALVIVGAGVAIAASGADPRASWTSLLEDALRWCKEHLHGQPGWSEIVGTLLKNGDVDSLLLAAETLTRWLGGRAGGNYRRWLHERVGSLPLADPSVPEALVGLGVPLATTNYDDLIERAAGWGWATWRDVPRLTRALRADLRTLAANERTVLHLHGHWDDPESVVLGIQSYDSLLNDQAAQALQRAMGTLRTVVLVGVGEGATDPNLGAVRRWLATTFPGVEHQHYRVCLDSEVTALRAEHAPGERIVPLPYGDRHEDLAGFLRGLVRTPAAPVVLSGRMAATLPAPRRTLGRSDEVTEGVVNLLGEPPAPTIILGSPGIGKTNLALAVLHDDEVAGRFGDRRHFVRCEGTTSASAVVNELARVLGVPLSGGDLMTGCLTRLAVAPAVVCLDNAETPWEADTLACEELFSRLAKAGGLLVSLRGGERPGGASWASPIRLEPLAAADARALFLSITEPRFDGSGLDELLAEMGGVPLAIELLAYAAEGEAFLARLADRWRAERVRLLERGTADHRLLSVAVSLEASWSSRLMTEPARRLLALLGRLPDGIAHADLEVLLPGIGAAAAGVLRRRGLAFDEADRLRTFPPLRHHLEVIHPPTLGDWTRAAAHYRELMTKLGPKVGGSGGAEAARRLATEVANLTVALLAELSGEVVRPAIDALRGAAQFARFTGVDLALIFAQGLEAARAANDAARLARTLFWLGVVASDRSDHEGARARYEEALALYRQVGDVQGEANCIQSLGQIALARSDPEGARARYGEALALYRQVGDVQGEANCILSLGDIALRRSDYEGARARYEEALALYRQVGSVLGEANCVKSLGDIALRRSDDEGAGARYEEALALYRQMGSVLGEANCVKSLGDIALGRSDPEEARVRYDEALALYRRVGDVQGEANCIQSLGDIALGRSDPEEARARYDEAVALYRQVGDVLGEANCIRSLGDIALRRSDDEGARARYDEALALYRRIAEPYSIGETQRRLARLARDAQTRQQHIEAARSAWTSIDRPDLVAELDAEFSS